MQVRECFRRAFDAQLLPPRVERVKLPTADGEHDAYEHRLVRPVESPGDRERRLDWFVAEHVGALNAEGEQAERLAALAFETLVAGKGDSPRAFAAAIRDEAGDELERTVAAFEEKLGLAQPATV